MFYENTPEDHSKRGGDRGGEGVIDVVGWDSYKFDMELTSGEENTITSPARVAQSNGAGSSDREAKERN